MTLADKIELKSALDDALEKLRAQKHGAGIFPPTKCAGSYLPLGCARCLVVWHITALLHELEKIE